MTSPEKAVSRAAEIAGAARTCATCKHAVGEYCQRDGLFEQSYEMRYTDSDFCGPRRRYYEKRSLFGTLQAILKDATNADQ